MILCRTALLLAVAWSTLAAPGCSAAEAPSRFTLQPRDGAIRVNLDGALFTEYLYKGFPKPILYPVIGPGGIAVTRDYPMKQTPGEPADHPHHQSLWFTHGSVNGTDFWAITPTSGQEVHDKFVKSEASGDHATIVTENKWIAPGDKLVCTDTRTITFRAFAGSLDRAIDYDITIHASNGDVIFGDTKEGSMGIRTIPALQLKGDEKAGVVAHGKMINSNGQDGSDCWGKRADWVDYWAPVGGRTIGVAIFDHPSNPRHPTWWHARDYGLIAANPFGVHDFEKKPPGAGNLTIKNGESITFRYRFLFHEGDADAAKIAARYKQYAAN